MRAICVFCGSSPGRDPIYVAGASAMGRAIAEKGLTLVYGGGKVGLMGAVADAALEARGAVVGVIPHALRLKEVAHEGLTELVVVETMHERKAAMADRADAFVAMAGGLGTLEEFFEVWTWGQLGLHQKPLGLLGAEFFAPLLTFLDRLVLLRFLRPEHREMVIVEDDPLTLIDRLSRKRPPSIPKWLDREER
jgi:uncharacterized protein (TIGR00730 family)